MPLTLPSWLWMLSIVWVVSDSVFLHASKCLPSGAVRFSFSTVCLIVTAACVFFLLFWEAGGRHIAHPPRVWPVFGLLPRDLSELCTSVQEATPDLIAVCGWCFPEAHSCALAFSFTLPFCVAHLACLHIPHFTTLRTIHTITSLPTQRPECSRNTAGTVFLSFTVLSQIMSL